MTPIPELIARLKSAIHEESVLISPRTSKLIEEVRFVVGELEGEGGRPAADDGDAWLKLSMAAALARIVALDPEVHSANGYNEWGEAECFNQAQGIAKFALGLPPSATGRSPSHPTSKGGVE
jgi:hypothetical protein